MPLSHLRGVEIGGAAASASCTRPPTARDEIIGTGLLMEEQLVKERKRAAG